MSDAVQQPAQVGNRLIFKQHFTTGKHPFEEVSWRLVDAILKSPDGTVRFAQKGIEAPVFWSQRAVNIVAEKYFRVVNGVKENSVKQMIHRVADTIAKEGWSKGYFAGKMDALTFEHELTYMLLHQMFSFNSPVWFNIGVPGVIQQASACFIQDVKDDMEDIVALQSKEVLLFKGGSGTGTNLSKIRSSYEVLSNGGQASGPVSFMSGYDAWAGATKSGGGTRRAAKMNVLNIDHPDILEQKNGQPGFITCKAAAEQIAHDLIDAGYPVKFNEPGNAYNLVGFQNANNSVRVTDQFMQAVAGDTEWTTHEVTEGLHEVHRYKAKMLWDEIALAAHFCGDPGIQFDTTTNFWHTCPNSGRINASNPCSEYLFLDDTACNLASFNLVKFYTDGFAVNDFKQATEVGITAMEILVGYSAYPSETIAKNSELFRPLGIGHANLGAMLMHMGFAYDSDEGREIAAGITAFMTGTAYTQSARMAGAVGPFAEFEKNRVPMLAVVRRHGDAARALTLKEDGALNTAIRESWATAHLLGTHYGYRNSQVSVLAPTGTISFMMDCDTTGIEPMLAVVTVKELVGQGRLTMLNEAVVPALENLGYTKLEIQNIMLNVEATGELAGIDEKHRKVFQTAIGKDPVTIDGHLLMMAAVQPFLSGGISKTVNMPSTATVDDVADTYWKSWKLGLKCVAIYRDGCKKSQPASAKKAEVTEAATPVHLPTSMRRRLPDDRNAVIHKFSIGGQEGYLHVGMYSDGKPGEVFIDISKSGSTLHGIVDMFATLMSIALQYGVPLETMVEKFKGTQFQPAGFTKNPGIPHASSIGDYLMRYMEQKFLLAQEDLPLELHLKLPPVPSKGVSLHGDPCRSCGNLTVRAGSCWVCASCGSTTGCG